MCVARSPTSSRTCDGLITGSGISRPGGKPEVGSATTKAGRCTAGAGIEGGAPGAPDGGANNEGGVLASGGGTTLSVAAAGGDWGGWPVVSGGVCAEAASIHRVEANARARKVGKPQ